MRPRRIRCAPASERRPLVKAQVLALLLEAKQLRLVAARHLHAKARRALDKKLDRSHLQPSRAARPALLRDAVRRAAGRGRCRARRRDAL
eukprot:6626258-Prymnesium_polylepis.1